MTNEFLTVSKPQWLARHHDRRNGQTYQRLLTFEDIADIGDGCHGQAVNDQAFTSYGSNADIALVHNGPMLTTFRVRTSMRVPSRFCFDTMTRSSDMCEQVIESLVSLRPGSARVEVESVVHNTAQDHRLRVLFPSGALAETYLADSPFDVVERPIALRSDNHTYRELETESNRSKTGRLYLINNAAWLCWLGLMESAVRDLPERPLADPASRYPTHRGHRR